MLKKNLANTWFVMSDWSGVVSDDRQPVHEANMRILEKRGIERLSFEAWLPQTTLSLREFCLEKGIQDAPEALFSEYEQQYMSVRGEGLHPVMYPGAPQFFEFLDDSGYFTAVVSSHPEKQLTREADEYGILRHIRTLVGSAKDKAFEMVHLANAKGFRVERIAYLGDTVYDIQAAKAAGVISIAVATGYHSRDRLAAEQPDYLVGSLTELGEMFRAA